MSLVQYNMSPKWIYDRKNKIYGGIGVIAAQQLVELLEGVQIPYASPKSIRNCLRSPFSAAIAEFRLS